MKAVTTVVLLALLSCCSCSGPKSKPSEPSPKKENPIDTSDSAETEENRENQKRALVVFEMFDEYHSQFAPLPIVDRETLVESPDSFVLVDVRKTEEMDVSMIPGALTQYEYEMNEEKYSGKKVAVYCTIGYRSGQYAKKLQSRGISAYNLKGSILGWIHEGGTLVNPEGQTTKSVHVYGERWNQAPVDYETDY